MFISDYLFFIRQIYRRYGIKAFYKQFRNSIRRPFSREIIKRFTPVGRGLEVGTGRQTIVPFHRTVLSDGFFSHGEDNSIAEIFFKADSIPFADDFFFFVISEHLLEHLTNPLKAIYEWKRVVKKGGVIYLFLPHKERMFDRKRENTTLEHLLTDYKNNTPDDDTTHLQDWIDNVSSNGLAPHYDNIPEKDLAKTGNMHHHVWVTDDIVELVEYAGMELLYTNDKVPDREDSFLVVARV